MQYKNEFISGNGRVFIPDRVNKLGCGGVACRGGGVPGLPPLTRARACGRVRARGGAERFLDCSRHKTVATTNRSAYYRTLIEKVHVSYK